MIISRNLLSKLKFGMSNQSYSPLEDKKLKMLLFAQYHNLETNLQFKKLVIRNPLYYSNFSKNALDSIHFSNQIKYGFLSMASLLSMSILPVQIMIFPTIFTVLVYMQNRQKNKSFLKNILSIKIIPQSQKDKQKKLEVILFNKSKIIIQNPIRQLYFELDMKQLGKDKIMFRVHHKKMNSKKQIGEYYLSFFRSTKVSNVQAMYSLIIQSNRYHNNVNMEVSGKQQQDIITNFNEFMIQNDQSKKEQK